jgi:hypothetical protein
MKKFQSLCVDYIEVRNKMVSIIEKIANLRSRKTFVTIENVQLNLGESVNASRLNVEVDNDLHDLFDELNSDKKNLQQIVLKISSCVADDAMKSSISTFVDIDFVLNLLNQIQQQSLLELNVVELLFDSNNSSMDHDGIITIIACFKYPPYLTIIDLKKILTLD